MTPIDLSGPKEPNMFNPSDDLSHILNWKLLNGSHDFPGPEGGTCINEAAIVAAGFEYRKISKADDCPPCFSRVLSAYALNLNDSMDDETRNALLTPFVTRLAGTADTPAIERERAEYMVIQTVRRFLPLLLRCAGLNTLAEDCERAVSFEKARDAAAHAAYANAAANAANACEQWQIAVEILDGAMAIGKRAEPIETALVVERMEAIKALSVSA